MARLHEDDLVTLAEMRAASNIKRTEMAGWLEQWRQDNFGFLTATENRAIKESVAQLTLDLPTFGQTNVTITERDQT